ncbi:MAG: YraN family protein [Clostridia bacterium]|nr:YraN family protein [Clostridia bacterium]
MKKIETETGRRGVLGERAAVRYLRRRLYRILECNWFFYRKEIDIIACRGRTLVICEVKTRTQSALVPSPYGPPSAAVNFAKQRNLKTAGRAYARSIRWRGRIRMDIIEVYLSPLDEKGRQKIERIVHLRDAFTA